MPSFSHRSRLSALAVVALTMTLAPALTAGGAASAAILECPTVDGATQISRDCVDPLYSSPVIDSETDETSPAPHHRVSGHFDGTNIEFTVYLHAESEKAKWEGRFYQSTYPIAFTPEENTAEASDRQLEFALASGGYAVASGNSAVSVGYRHDAAAAQVARGIAARYYGLAEDYESVQAIPGYLYGASGGSLQTIGAAENTNGIWQGFVPTVQAVQQPTGYNFLGRSAAELILAGKAQDIRAAVLPGGSGDPYATLDAAETAMLKEVTALGIPLKGWEFPDYLLLGNGGAGLDPDAPLDYDPTYVDDFWIAAGYLGTEQSPLGDRVRAELTAAGDTIENRWNIANRFYYRYQLPAAEEKWTGLDQFRDAAGEPIYPQRPVMAPISRAASGGASFDGNVNGKVIAVSNLYDTDALPWHTDWYGQRVRQSLGSAADDTYRVYFNDHADHQGPPVPGEERSKHLIDWYGSTEQALRDIAAWAEDDVTPPASTSYGLIDTQIVVPANAEERKGIQPVIDLTVDGEKTVTVEAGQPVPLQARAQTPAGTGEIVDAEWDVDGDGVFTDADPFTPAPAVEIGTSPAFDEAGSYLVAVRVTSQRDADASTPFARVQNLDRVRVIVTQSACAAAAPCGAVVAGAPSIAGDPVVGSALSVVPGGWSPSDLTFSYQWFADGTPVNEATADVFTPTEDLVGARITVAVTGSATGLFSATATTEPTAPVASAATSPSPSASPTAATPVPPREGGSAPRAAEGHLARTGSATLAPGALLAALLLLPGGLLFGRFQRRSRV